MYVYIDAFWWVLQTEQCKVGCAACLCWNIQCIAACCTFCCRWITDDSAPDLLSLQWADVLCKVRFAFRRIVDSRHRGDIVSTEIILTLHNSQLYDWCNTKAKMKRAQWSYPDSASETFMFSEWFPLLKCHQVVYLSSPLLSSPDYLLSNNHVNSIIVHKFDFSDEEIMAYYISFLKTLSLKLNNHTVHFFYNEVRPQRGEGRWCKMERMVKHWESVIQHQQYLLFMQWPSKGRKRQKIGWHGVNGGS